MKPSWDDAPDWAEWLAMESDGRWYWHEQEPVWAPRERFWWSWGTEEFAGEGINPKDSLEQRHD